MKPWLCLLVAAATAGCAGLSSPPEPLTVKTHMLRSADVQPGGDPMVRGQQLRRLHGAVSMAERANLLGQYLTAQWNDPTGVGNGEVEVRFEYRQGATASRVKRATRTFPATDASGIAEFSIIGDDYLKGGRVLAWRITLTRGGRILASQQSYLWQ
jgi:hypothetical protein